MDRGKYDLNAREYDVIRFYYRSQGISLGMIYDLETGILLHHTADYTSNLPTEEGGMVTRGQNAIMRLRNLRQVNIPWNDGRVPSWARGEVLFTSRVRTHSGCPSCQMWLPQSLPSVCGLTYRRHMSDL